MMGLQQAEFENRGHRTGGLPSVQWDWSNSQSRVPSPSICTLLLKHRPSHQIASSRAVAHEVQTELHCTPQELTVGAQ